MADSTILCNGRAAQPGVLILAPALAPHRRAAQALVGILQGNQEKSDRATKPGQIEGGRYSTRVVTLKFVGSPRARVLPTRHRTTLFPQNPESGPGRWVGALEAGTSSVREIHRPIAHNLGRLLSFAIPVMVESRDFAERRIGNA